MKTQHGYLTHESGKWLGHYSLWITDAATGQRKRRQRAFVIGPVATFSKTQARNKLRERLASEIGIQSDSRATVAWFIACRWKPLRAGTWRESTAGTNDRMLKMVTNRFGNTALEDLDNVEMQAWLNELAKTKSGSVVERCRIFLKSICTEAVEQDYLRKSPARLLRLPILKEPKKPYLTLPQIKSLLHATKWFPRDRALLRLVLATALRPSELFALRWKCLDTQRGILTIQETVYRGVLRNFTKTTEQDATELVTVPVATPALVGLCEWYQDTKFNGDDDFIFANTEGGFINTENYCLRVLNMLAGMAGIKKLNFQILRRTFATHCSGLGSPKDLATLMRHTTIDTSQKHYIMAIEESVKETAEKLADKIF